jgi:hypothetical protein
MSEPRRHVHLRLLFKDKKSGKVLHEARKWIPDTSLQATLSELLDELTPEYVVERYRQDYTYYKDGETEYIKFHAHLFDEADNTFTLTVHVFSCYCEPLNVNTEPPF